MDANSPSRTALGHNFLRSRRVMKNPTNISVGVPEGAKW
jgi:hypothetical protein